VLTALICTAWIGAYPGAAPASHPQPAPDINQIKYRPLGHYDPSAAEPERRTMPATQSQIPPAGPNRSLPTTPQVLSARKARSQGRCWKWALPTAA
jgi:hypothetical protein